MSEVRGWKKWDRSFAERARGIFLPEYKRAVIEGHDVVVLTNGKGKEPSVYLRQSLTLADIARGRRVTNPWRKVST